MARTRLRPAPVLGGLLAIAAYAALAETVVFRSEMGKAFLYLSWRESLFWLSHHLLLLPGLLALGWGLAPRIGPALGRLGERVAALPRPALRRGLVVYALVLVALAMAGRSFLLQDLPVTNDEYTMEFGARILAAGRWMAPDIDPDLGLSMPYVYRRDGAVTTMDFPGTPLFLAAAIVTGLGHVLFALAVALSGAALVAACGLTARRAGPGPGPGTAAGTAVATAALVWGLSPMVLSLSYTRHSQLLSRIFVALAYAVYLRLLYRGEGPDPGRGPERPVLWGGLLGLAAACGFVCRPAETSAVLAPVALHLLARSLGGATRRRTVLAAGAVAALGPLLLAVYNQQVTGSWRVSARVLANRTMHDPFWTSSTERLGENLGFNVMMLALWFFGPLGVVLALFGAASRRPGARTCVWSLGLHLGLALFHSDTGIHLVGPIHYSEAAVPLLVLAVLGLEPARRLTVRLAPSRGAPSRGLATTLAVAYLLSILIWNGVHSGTLADQAAVQRAHLDAVAHLDHAVVVADRPYRLWFTRPEIGAVGTWVADLPHPDPFLRDPVLFAYPEADLDALRRAFPDRRLYRMTYAAEGEPVRVEPLEP